MSRLSFYLFTIFALTICRLHAQEDDEDEEEFGHMGFFGRSTESVTVGVKLTQSAKIHFGELGTVPSNVPLPSNTEVNRGYNDGYVLLDAKRTGTSKQSEDSTLGQFQVSTSGNRYLVTGDDPLNNITNGVILGNYISHSNGFTREWGYRNESQVHAPTSSSLGYIAFHNYSAETQHATAEGNRGYSNGIDLTLTHLLYRANKRVSFSLVTGISLTGINSMHAGTVKSSLHIVTDKFLLNNIQPLLPITTGGFYGTYISTNTSGVDFEDGQLISNLPDAAGAVEDDADGATVDGIWKVKGAYFTFKIGPQITALLTPSFGFSASIGATGSYVGTTYSADESFTVDGIPNKISYQDSSNKNSFRPGYYANLEATWTLNGRTGFFAGFSYENLGVVNQRLAGRTAKIDLNNTAGIRGGLNIKF